jgi:serine/threonine protein kinase
MHIALEIALGMEYLHENKIYHYHLSSKNIYLNDQFTPIISDYGFHYLKDISSVFIKYKNKNSYTSPELLKENKIIGNTTSNSENFQKNDIYSFGILLWELYTCTVPFNISLNNLYNYVVVNGYRPEITKDFNPDIAELIRACWDSDPNKRPGFIKIVEILDKSI